MLRAVIIDDEPAAINALKMIVEKHINEIEIVSHTTDCHYGIRYIEENKPEIVFLDISMPEMSGFTLLKQLSWKDFNLVFTTAHERYAIQAIRSNATDYLVKPIDIDELRQTVENIKGIREKKVNSLPDQPGRRLEFKGRIGLPVKEGLFYQQVSDIIRIESDGNYCTFFTCDEKKYVVGKNIGEFEDILPSLQFFRCHKSHMINMVKVKKYIRTDGYFVEMEDGSVVEISRRKKDEFLERMNSGR